MPYIPTGMQLKSIQKVQFNIFGHFQTLLIRTILTFMAACLFLREALESFRPSHYFSGEFYIENYKLTQQNSQNSLKFLLEILVGQSVEINWK